MTTNFSGPPKHSDAAPVDTRASAAELDLVAVGVGRRVGRQQRGLLVAAQSRDGRS